MTEEWDAIQRLKSTALTANLNLNLLSKIHN